MNFKTRFEYASEVFLVLKSQYQHKLSNVFGDVLRTLCQYGFGWIAENNDLQVRSALLQIENPTGTFLDSLVASLPMTARKPSATATVKVVFVVGDSITTPIVVAKGTQVVSDTNIVFTVDTDTTLTRTAYIDCTCTRSGAIGNVAAYSINQIKTSINGIMAVYNTDAATGGADSEDDITLNARRKAFYDGLSKGTVQALEYGAKEVTSVVYAGCMRSYPAPGECTIAVGDGNGNATTDMIVLVETNLDSGGVSSIKGYVTAGGKVYVEAFTKYLIKTTITVGVATGYQLGDIRQSIIDTINSLIRSLGPGVTLTTAAIAKAVKDSLSTVDHVFSVTCEYVTFPKRLPIVITGFSGESWEESVFEWNYSGTSLRWEGGDWVQVQPDTELWSPIVTFANAERTSFLTAIVGAWIPGNGYPQYSMDEVIERGSFDRFLTLEKNEFPTPIDATVLAEGLTSA